MDYRERMRSLREDNDLTQAEVAKIIDKLFYFTPKGMYVSNFILSRMIGEDLVIPGSNS